MSTSWDVYCFDCDEHLGLNEVRRPLCDALIAAWRETAALGPLGRQHDLEMRVQGTSVRIAFFEDHGSHRLVARNEYGELGANPADLIGGITASHPVVKSE